MNHEHILMVWRPRSSWGASGSHSQSFSWSRRSWSDWLFSCWVIQKLLFFSRVECDWFSSCPDQGDSQESSEEECDSLAQSSLIFLSLVSTHFDSIFWNWNLNSCFSQSLKNIIWWVLKKYSLFTDLTPSVLGKVVFLCLEFLCSHSPPRCCQYQWWTPLLHQHCWWQCRTIN